MDDMIRPTWMVALLLIAGLGLAPTGNAEQGAGLPDAGSAPSLDFAQSFGAMVLVNRNALLVALANPTEVSVQEGVLDALNVGVYCWLAHELGYSPGPTCLPTGGLVECIEESPENALECMGSTVCPEMPKTLPFRGFATLINAQNADNYLLGGAPKFEGPHLIVNIYASQNQVWGYLPVKIRYDPLTRCDGL